MKDISQEILNYDIETEGKVPVLEIGHKFGIYAKHVCEVLRANGRGRKTIKPQIRVFGVKITETDNLSFRIDIKLHEIAKKMAKDKDMRVEDLISSIIQKGLESP
jgi:hypothetical protein